MDDELTTSVLIDPIVELLFSRLEIGFAHEYSGNDVLLRVQLRDSRSGRAYLSRAVRLSISPPPTPLSPSLTVTDA